MACFKSAGTSLFKRLVAISLLLVPVLFLSCVPGYKYMVDQKTKPPFETKRGKAVLVIERTTSFNWSYVINNYLDGKMIGQTLGKSYFITEVQPGSHYVMGQAQNIAVARINFEADRIYFLQQSVYAGAFMMRTGFNVLTAQDGVKQTAEEGSSFGVYDAQHTGPDMDKKDYEEARANFEKEVKENPDRHKDTLNYKGFSKL